MAPGNSHVSLSGAAERTPERVPPAIPDHRLLRCIGRGSYGEVWLAQNVVGAYRAVKVVYRADFEDGRPYEREFAGIQKFEPVSRTHPNLTAVLHVGRPAEDAYFYYVMELADAGDDGVPRPSAVPEPGATDVGGQRAFDPQRYVPRTLRHEIRRRGPLPVSECLAIGASLAEGAEHLHRSGLVHRDIKPSNVIFVNGRPKLADIGLVAAVDESRSLVGTEGFVAPEGAGSPQADVFSLGRLLYESATGKDRVQYPAPRTDLGGMPDRESAQELNEVILRACEPDPSDRYPGMAALRADLLLIQAGGSLRRSRVLERRFRRLRQGVLIAAGLILGAGLIFYLVERERAELLRAQVEVQRFKREASEAQTRAALARIESITPLALQAVEQHFAADRPREAISMLARVLDQDRSNHVVAERLLAALTERSFALPTAPFLRHASEVTSARWSADGAHVVTASRDGTARVWDAASGKAITPPLVHGSPIRCLEISPDRQAVLTAAEDGTAQVWELRSGAPVGGRLGHTGAVLGARFAPGGQAVVTASRDGTAVIWDFAGTRRAAGPLRHEQAVNVACFSPDGTRVLTASADGTARIWSATSGLPIDGMMRHPRAILWAEFSPDGLSVVTASEDGAALIWDLREAGGPRRELRHAGPVRMACFSPEGRRVLTASADGTARLWDRQTGKALTPALRHEEALICARFSPDGLRVLTAAEDYAARIWDPLSGKPLTEPLGHRGKLTWAEFSPDGQRAVTASDDTTACIWDVRAGQALRTRKSHGYEILDLDLSSDGRYTMVGMAGRGSTADGAVQVSDRDSPAIVPVTGTTPSAARLVGFSPDGQRALAVCGDAVVWTWNVPEGRKLQDRVRHQAAVHRAEFSPDGRMLLTASDDATAAVWDATTGRLIVDPLHHRGPVFDARFSPDGRLVVTASADSTARTWRLPSGQPTGIMLHHSRAVRCAEFSQDGRLILTASDDATVCVWDVETGQRVIDPLRHNRGVRFARFDPAAGRLVTLSHRNQAWLWELDAALGPRNPLVLPDAVLTAEFSADGTRLLTVLANGTAQVWDTTSALPLSEPMKHDQPLNCARFLPDGEMVATASQDGALALWEVPRTNGEAPAWLVDLARFLAADVLAQAWARSHERAFEDIRSQAGAGVEGDTFTRWGGWFFADRSARNATPFGETLVAGYAAHRLLAPHVSSLLEVAQLQPTNSTAWARLRGALARTNPETDGLLLSVVDHRMCRAAEQTPEDRAVLWTALEAWIDHDETAAGLEAMDRALARQPLAINPQIAKGFLHWSDGRREEARAHYQRALELAFASSDSPEHLRRTMLLNRAALMRRIGRTEEAAADYRSVVNIPDRDSTVSSQALDLSLFINAALDEPWYDFRACGNHWLQSTAGWRGSEVRDLPTDIRGVIQLTNPTLDRTAPGFPSEVTGIPVGLTGQRVCFVHATCGVAPEGTVVASYTIHYATGALVEIPIRYGPDVRAWRVADDPDGPVAPFQENRNETNLANETVRVLSTVWTNPLPATVIATIDFRSARASAAPLLLAVTLD